MKSPMPRTHIHKAYLLCLKCQGPTNVLMSSPFNKGQHRRHKCKHCGFGFYSLTPYDGEDTQVSPLPFKDSPLSDLDKAKRKEAWEEFDNLFNAPSRLPSEVTHPILEEMRIALDTPDVNRTPRQAWLVAVCIRCEEKGTPHGGEG